MVRHSTWITFTVNGTTGSFLPRSVDSVRQIVIDALTPFFDVSSVAFTTDSFLEDPLHSLSNWRYNAIVRAMVRADYGDIRDVDSIVANAFYQATGELPTVTANGIEAGQNEPDTKQGFSLTTALVLVIVGLIAVAVISVEV